MAGLPVWPGIFPGARLSRAHKAKIIEAFDTSGTVKEARSMGFGAALVGVDIKTDNLGWAGVFWSDAFYSPSLYNTDYLMGSNANFTLEETHRRMNHGVHPLGRLGRRDYDFFARLAGVRGDGPEPNGVPPDASALTQRHVSRWGDDGHSHVHMTLREFVKRKIITDVTIADAAKSKLQGGDPIAEYLGNCVDDNDNITLDDNTRVIAWFDN